MRCVCVSRSYVQRFGSACFPNDRPGAGLQCHHALRFFDIATKSVLRAGAATIGTTCKSARRLRTPRRRCEHTGCEHTDCQRPSVRLPEIVLWLRRVFARVRPDRARTKSRLELASLSPNRARSGNGCCPARSRIRPGSACRRRHLDGIRCQFGRSRHADSRTLTSRLHSR
jgi:hypothetical protein